MDEQSREDLDDGDNADLKDHLLDQVAVIHDGQLALPRLSARKNQGMMPVISHRMKG